MSEIPSTITVEARDLPNIENGRKFVILANIVPLSNKYSQINWDTGEVKPTTDTIRIHGNSEFGIRPPLLAPPLDVREITYNGRPAQILGHVSEGSRLQCSECETIYMRYMLSHDNQWMYTALACPDHLDKFLLDIFPKYTYPEGRHNWVNAFYGFSTPTALPEGVQIENYESNLPDQIFRNRVGQPDYSLTPDGLVPLREPYKQGI